MPLPDVRMEFPPKPMDVAYREHRIHNAWYVGDTDALAGIYGNGGEGSRASVLTRFGFGRMQPRYFWGRENRQQSNKLHVPAPADLARISADLLFSQPPKFDVPTDYGTQDSRKKIQARMDLLFNSDAAAATMLEAGEVCSALGGTYLRLWWDEEVSDHVQIGAVHADAAIPEWRYNQLVAVTFWTKVLDDNGIVLRHLERHEPGRILHGLYQGDEGNLGQAVPLEEADATKWAAGLVNSDGAIETGDSVGLTAAYVPNVRPNRKWRTTPGLTQLGRSDFDGLEPMFDALDETYTSWMRDIDLGKGRLFVDEDLIDNRGRGKGARFDSEQSIFSVLAGGLGAAKDAGGNVQAVQFQIRWQEHSQTCAELLNVILRGAGQSANNFSDTALTVGVKTATEVNSENQLSERTRAKKINYWKAALRPLAATALMIDDAVFDTGADLNDTLPDLNFPVRSTRSPVDIANSVSTLLHANAMSIEQAVLEQHPNWDKGELDTEVKRILAQKQQDLAGFAEPDSDDGAGEGQFDPNN